MEEESPAPEITIASATPDQVVPTDPSRGWPPSSPGFDTDPSSPGKWSTAATPGTASYLAFDLPSGDDPRRARVSGELEGIPEQVTPEESLSEGPPPGRPASIQPPPWLTPHLSEPGSTPSTGTVHPHTETYTPPRIDSVGDTTSQPPIKPYQRSPSPSLTTHTPAQQPAPQVIRNVAPPPPPPVAPAPAPQPTPKQIAQAQKHCRYAISALDYEDFERARQDLLDALKIIGG